MTGAVPVEPELSPDEQALFARGVSEFNHGYYFECHDTLEELWNGLRGPVRDFFQGLIQVSVAHYHLTGGNAEGARSMFGRALKRFERYPERYFGFDLAGQRAEIAEWLERLSSGALPEPGQAPQWRFEVLAGAG